MKALHLDIQYATTATALPSKEQIQAWVTCALENTRKEAELSIRLVDESESQMLNTTYRQKQRPTNVLSFPAELPDIVNSPLLGDIVICAPIVHLEAQQQDKDITAHWAHLVIHGTLHLIGYDHVLEEEALAMEDKEVALLRLLGFPSPYD